MGTYYPGLSAFAAAKKAEIRPSLGTHLGHGVCIAAVGTMLMCWQPYALAQLFQPFLIAGCSR
jgi:hypothetical protein